MSNNRVHLMLDTETLGKREDTVILSIACVPFTLEDHDYFKSYLNKGIMIKFSVEEQIKKFHRSITTDTIEWWKQQSKEARDANLKPSPNDMTAVEGLTLLSKFISDSGYNHKKSYVWARGTNFDFPKIEHFYEDCANLTLPFNTWKIRDTRTYIDILTGTDDGKYELKFGDIDNFVAHNCLHDAAMEAAKLSEIYYLLNEEDDIPF